MSVEKDNLGTDHIGNYQLMPFSEYLERKYPGVPAQKFVSGRMARDIKVFKFAVESDCRMSRDLEEILNKEYLPIVAIDPNGNMSKVPFMLDTVINQYTLYSSVLEQIKNDTFHTDYDTASVLQWSPDIEGEDIKKLMDSRIDALEEIARMQYKLQKAKENEDKEM